MMDKCRWCGKSRSELCIGGKELHTRIEAPAMRVSSAIFYACDDCIEKYKSENK